MMNGITFTDAEVTDDDGIVFVDPMPPSNVSIENARALWSGVILRMLHDAAGLVGSSIKPSSPMQRVNAHKDALEFFARGGPDFEAICIAAGVNAQAARSAAMRALRDEDQLRGDLAHRRSIKGLEKEATG